MDWTHLIISGASVIATFAFNFLVLRKKHNAESRKEEIESTDLLANSNKECYEQLTDLRKKFALQEKRTLELELLIIKLENDNSSSN